jgi:hypothetical protein
VVRWGIERRPTRGWSRPRFAPAFAALRLMLARRLNRPVRRAQVTTVDLTLGDRGPTGAPESRMELMA